MQFHTTVELGGKTATGLPVPEDIVTALGAGKKPAVTVTVAGHTYRSSIAARGGRFMIPLSAEHRAAAGLAAGDEVDVDVELDAAPRVVIVPPDLADALAAEPAAKRRFDVLSYSNQSRYVLSVDAARTDDTRRRRIAKTVAELAATDD